MLNDLPQKVHFATKSYIVVLNCFPGKSANEGKVSKIEMTKSAFISQRTFL